MKIGAIYSHLNGLEWIQVHQPEIINEIKEIIGKIDAEEYKTKKSKEKGERKGNMVYSPIDLNKKFKKEFSKRNWKENRTTYWVTDDYNLIQETMKLTFEEQKRKIEAAGKNPIYSYNQTDFVKNEVAIEIQFGKYSFIAYDLFVKHLAFYIGNQIEVGVEVLPMKSMQLNMSSGPGYYESALYDMARQGKSVPAVPLVLIGIEP